MFPIIQLAQTNCQQVCIVVAVVVILCVRFN